MFRYGREEFVGVKNAMFSLIDSETEAQRNIETHAKYDANRVLKLLNTKLD